MGAGRVILVTLVATIAYILKPLSVPLPFDPIPVSLAGFTVFLTVFILKVGGKAVDFVVCLLLKTINIPIFSSFHKNLRILTKPAKKCLVKFVFLTLVVKFTLSRFSHGLIPAVVKVVVKVTMYCTFKAM